MLTSYFKLAWRNLRKNSVYSLINISGLTVGMLCFLFIFLYVKDELSYDDYRAGANTVYRLNFYGKLGDQSANSASSPGPAGPAFKEAFPEISDMCRLRQKGSFVVRYNDRSFSEEHVIFSDSTLFNLFPFRLLEGDPASALREPNSAVITESMAKKYFGDVESAVGKALTFDNERLYKVTGVMEEVPKNTHFYFNCFLSMSSLGESREEEWGSTNFHTYFALRPGTDPGVLSRKASDLFVQHFTPVLKQFLNISWEEFTRAGNYARVEFFPVRKIHLYSDLHDELAANGDIRYVYILSIVGLLILALACINFMNLATARSAVRAKEVGVRKAVGAARGDLTRQFLSESVLMSLIAWMLSIAGLLVLLPFFCDLAGKKIAATALSGPGFLLPSLALAVVVGLAAGTYPAFILSAFKPVKVLKGALSGLAPKSNLRSGLVVFQFFTTTVLLISALVVYRQLEFIRHKKLGFNKEQVLVLNDAYLLGNKLTAFKERMLQNPAIRYASASSFLPVTFDRNTTSIIKGKNPTPENTLLVNNWWADQDYLKTMGFELVEGRDFSTDLRSDSTAVVVNEVLAKSFGYPQQPVVGQEIGLPREEGNIEMHQIVGVVRNFHFASLRQNIEPLAIFVGGAPELISFRLQTADIKPVIRDLQSVWNEMAPGQPFEYTFLDQRFDRMYEAETRTGKIAGTFAFLAVFIACIGLFGLATFTTQQRTKEIGVRKVLGASVAGLTGMLARDFLKLVILAIAIAVPLAYYFMQKWLADFAYRIDLQWWMFGAAGMSAVAVAFLTVSFQSIKAALANPVKSLRNE